MAYYHCSKNKNSMTVTQINQTELKYLTNGKTQLSTES